MSMGQVGKGVVILLAAIGIGILTAGTGWFLIHAAVAVDAYMVASALKQGQTVGKWQFFPT
jgi:hypothetical protein